VPTWSTSSSPSGGGRLPPRTSRDRSGAALVEEQRDAGARCTTANWSEVAQKVLAAGRDWALARSLLLAYDLELVPVTVEDAEAAARLWSRGAGLSLGDRLCLACAERLGVVAWTADVAWGVEGVRQIR
jgi:ribonuclease VapC